MNSGRFNHKRRIPNHPTPNEPETPNEARHRMSGDSINFNFGHRRTPLIGGLGRSAESPAIDNSGRSG